MKATEDEMKLIEDEIKGLITKNMRIRSAEAQERVKAFQRSLDIMRKYKRKYEKEPSTNKTGENQNERKTESKKNIRLCMKW